MRSKKKLKYAQRGLYCSIDGASDIFSFPKRVENGDVTRLRIGPYNLLFYVECPALYKPGSSSLVTTILC